MRTVDDILKQVEEWGSNQFDDFFGNKVEEVLNFVPWEQKKQYYKEEFVKKVEAGEEKPTEHSEITEENIKRLIVDYLPFAWDKANNCRGISAQRSIDHFRALFWLLGDEETLAELNNEDRYYHYGKPLLEMVSEKVEFAWRAVDNGLRGNDEDEQRPWK